MLLKGVFRPLQSLLDLSAAECAEFFELFARGRIGRRNRHAFTVGAVYLSRHRPGEGWTTVA
jgi:hypothetical protein